MQASTHMELITHPVSPEPCNPSADQVKTSGYNQIIVQEDNQNNG